MTTPHRFGKYLLRVATGAALIVLLFPSALFAANLNTLTSVSNAGITITNGATVYRSDFPSETTFWVFNFSWPNSVPNLRANFFLIRGTFGAVDGSPQEGVNYTTNNQSWAAGNNSIGKSFQFAPGGANLPSGIYTALVADTTSLSATMDWFASGGALGVEPVHYSTITFTYSSSGRVEEVPGALQSVQYGNRVIQAGDVVYRKEILPDLNNPSALWRFVFSWPNVVSNANSRLMIFHGTFGNLVGGLPTEGENYSATSQSWVSGQNALAKFMSFPVLESAAAPSGTYTVLVAENQPFGTTEGIVEWFSTGGASGTGPRRYSTLTFEYPKYEECCSSVVFIPGFQGTKLKVGTNDVWPPTLYDVETDLELLKFSSQGESLHDVRAGGVVDKAYVVSIYDGFLDFLDSLAVSTGNGTIHEWYPLAYDWRYPPKRVVQEGVQTVGGHVNVLQKIEELALRSDTGQVTLVGHSNGGLVGKVLIKELEALGKETLVDSFVMVGSPQLGTPQAVGGLLHGEKSELGFLGFNFVNKAQARALAQNFESAYTLLPSRAYFGVVTDAVVSFNEEADYTDPWRALWGSAVGNFTELFEFLGDVPNVRTAPTFADTQTPAILNQELLSRADDFHTEYDSYEIPTSIRTVQVAGWGLPTIERIRYTEYEPYSFAYFVPDVSTEGDGTVVYPSALALAEEAYYFNLLEFIKTNTNLNHINLLNASPIQNIVNNVVRKTQAEGLEFISSAKPDVSNSDSRLLVAVHSPVTLGVYDSQGRFAGIDRNFDPASGVELIKEEIPNSRYFAYGEGKYLFVPSDGSYSFVFEGTGEGLATIEVGEVSGNILTPLAAFSSVEVQNTLKARLEIGTAESLELLVDSDGDGSFEVTLEPDGAGLSIPELILLLKERIVTLETNERLKKNLLKRVEKIEKKLAKLKTAQALKKTSQLSRFISRREGRGRLDSVEAQELINLIEQLENQLQ